MTPPSGYILIDKPADITSFACLRTLKGAFTGSKIGHTGTLDSFATGLLIVVVGAYTRLVPWFMGMDKEYAATIVFGQTTDTLDPHGKFTGEGRIPDEAELRGAIAKYAGEFLQLPPAYSAKHVKGARASTLARRGQQFELSPKKVRIHAISLENWGNSSIDISVKCSSGTYIRSLARDIAEDCGTVAYVSALRRTKVGSFSVESSSDPRFPIDESALRTITAEDFLSMGLRAKIISKDDETAFKNGNKSLLKSIGISGEKNPEIAIFSEQGEFLGIVRSENGSIAYSFVVPTPQVRL